jgi:hypothetical protein
MKSVDQDDVARAAREFQPLVEAEKALAREWLLDDAQGKRTVDDDSVDRLAAILASVRWGRDQHADALQPGMASVIRFARALSTLSAVEKTVRAALDELRP